MEMTLDHLERTCTRLLPGEQVQAMGLFMPYGVMAATGAGVGLGAMAAPGAAGMAMSAAAGLAGARGFAAATGQPPYTVLAVTPTHVYAYDASTDGGMWATADFSGPPYATWDRGAIGVHVSRFFTHFHLTIDDHATGTSWEYKGNPVYKVGGKLVAALLADPDEG